MVVWAGFWVFELCWLFGFIFGFYSGIVLYFVSSFVFGLLRGFGGFDGLLFVDVFW